MQDNNNIETQSEIIETDEKIDILKGDDIENFIKNGLNAEYDDIDETIDSDEASENQDIDKKDKKDKKKPRKQQIIDDIKELSKKMGVECDTDNKLLKTKIQVLEKTLSKLVEKSLTCNLDVDVIKKSVKHDEAKVKTTTEQVPDNLASDALYNINFLLVNTVENVANSFDLPISLEGLTQKMDQTKKEELKAVLLKIVGNHGSFIKPFLSPMAMYAFIMLTTIQETIADNLKKKSKVIK